MGNESIQLGGMPLQCDRICLLCHFRQHNEELSSEAIAFFGSYSPSQQLPFTAELMSTQYSTNLTVQAAQELLKPFNCLASKTVNSESEKVLLRQAILLLAEHSDYQILGICADTATQGISALKIYSEALGYQPNLALASVEGSVYIKFNPNTSLCYLEAYSGTHRGVLVSYQSADEGDINEMYGHLPLDLFE